MKIVFLLTQSTCTCSPWNLFTSTSDQSMLTVNFSKWNQTPEDLRTAAMTAKNARTPSVSALYDVTQLGCGATEIARRTRRHAQTLISWVHLYNDLGPDALIFTQTGGPSPLLPGDRASGQRKTPRGA